MEGTTEQITTSAPSTPTPAAPATSAPATTVAPAERPTFAQAFASDAAPQTPTPPADAGTATTAPATETSPESAKGPIPFDVHKTALDNARTKATEQLRTEMQQQYGWTEGLDRQTVESGMQIGKMYQQDRAGFIRQVLAEAITDENLAPLVRSEAARVLGTRRSQEQPAAQTAAQSVPDVPILNEQGQVVGNLRDIVQAHLSEFAEKELGPMKQDYQTRQQQQAAEKATRELQTTVRDAYAEASSLPGFEDHKAEIAKVFATIPGDPAKALRTAWQRVVGPKLGSIDQVKANTLKELQTKAAASTASPASAALPTTKRVTSFHDKSLTW